MKSIALLLTLSLSLTAFAQKDPNAAQTKQLVQLLLDNPTVKVVSKASGKVTTVSQVLAQVLTDTNSDDDTQVALSFTSNCKDNTPAHFAGSSIQTCSVIALFTYTDKAGVTTESSYDLRFDVQKAVVPNAKPVLKGAVTLNIAG